VGLREAEKGSKEKAAEKAAAEELKKNAEQVLENFIGYNVLCFNTLRDKASKAEEDPSQVPATSSPAAAKATSPSAAIGISPPAGSQ